MEIIVTESAEFIDGWEALLKKKFCIIDKYDFPLFMFVNYTPSFVHLFHFHFVLARKVLPPTSFKVEIIF